ncbi:MAG: type II toxin-antitoxin system YafQ family toxin [Prevotella sp.]|nr:type II toxin-antitoxin system YafQ family toxin [Prevotella sp.]
MYSIDYTKRFKKDLKRCQKRGLDLQLIHDAITLLRNTGALPAQYRPHKLSGN